MASVRKRTWSTNGREHVAWVVDYKDGAGRRRLKTFKAKKAADAWAVQAQHQVAAGTHTPERDSVTVATAAGMWLRSCAGEGLEPHTLRMYRSHVDQHIAPTLGTARLAKLTAPMVTNFATNMMQSTSRATARKVLVSLRALLGHAQRHGLVAQNVAQVVRVARQQRHEEKVEILTPDEVRHLLAAVSDQWRPFLLLAVFTGLRASELRGLRWRDVDLEAARLTVDQRADEKGVMGSPKSASSRRTVPLPPTVRAALAGLAGTSPGELVFPNRMGKPHSLANIQNRVWGPLQLECGIVTERAGKDGRTVVRPRFGLHVLRHFFASWLIDQSFAPKRVQELMGHSTIKLTLDTYGHLWPDQEGEAARFTAAEAALLGPIGEPDATRMRQEPASI